ncbi:glycosyltransferase family 4 protein [Mycolicibacterium arenosum]|uniref:Glycosyltransferase family 4 protein n=1 Tax=Mycolicibacterium arenosum TaxID=2952157 RepID=A0ABT1MA52_9MYCO|nr:glycosyltransferase family 4 protein [Mycolicibacterium sp. CAU 1645]MCP9275282.1 glycosyltransferase family 4 protein [Mycolicibacterium sp. CAU 1645]
MVSAYARPSLGGVETHIHEVARRIVDDGTEVTVVTTDRSNALPARDTADGYRVERYRAYPPKRDYYISPALARGFRPEEFDLVHVQGVHTLVPPVALAVAQRAGVPTLLTFHSGGHSNKLRGRLRSMQWRCFAPLLNRADALIAVSDFERAAFASVLNRAPESIRLIRNGADPLPVDSAWQSPSGDPLMVSVGRLERYKGHHRVLAAMPAILQRRPNARLVLVGSGQYESALRELATELGVDDRVSVCAFGPDRRPQMGKLISDANVMCLLSEYEAHPVSVMEAVGAGTNALVADTSGLSELGRVGLASTIPLRSSPEATADAVIAVAEMSPPQGSFLTTWDECAEALLRVYHDVADRSAV